MFYFIQWNNNNKNKNSPFFSSQYFVFYDNIGIIFLYFKVFKHGYADMSLNNTDKSSVFV